MFERKRVVLLTLVICSTVKKLDAYKIKRNSEAKNYLLNRLFKSDPVLVYLDSDESIDLDFDEPSDEDTKMLRMNEEDRDESIEQEDALRVLAELGIIGNENDPNSVNLDPRYFNVLRSRCQAKYECESKCPKKQKPKCKKSCKKVFDDRDRCAPKKKTKCPSTGSTMPPNWGIKTPSIYEPSYDIKHPCDDSSGCG